MIEIIQEENWDDVQDRRGLPKNIKQIGTPDAGDRIYIENSAYQKMHPYGQSAEKMVYVMLGRFDEFAGHICIFVEDVVKMNEIEFSGKLPTWKDDSWGYLYRKIRPEQENMIIVGWAVDICGQLPSMTAQLERIHQTYFGGTHQVLLLMDTLEREETFFSNRNGYLKRREGFYIYYDKTIPGRMESAMEALRSERQKSDFAYEEDEVSRREERYRDYLNSRRADRYTPEPPRNSSNAPTFLLLVAILALGYSAFWNHQKMESMERAISQIELQAAMQTEVEKENAVHVEEVTGNITSGTSTEVVQNATQIPETQQTSVGMEPATLQNVEQIQTETSTQVTVEPVEKQQEYYVVQAGDSLAGICRKIYNSESKLKELCELNGIENPDAILVGQRLRLPD